MAFYFWQGGVSQLRDFETVLRLLKTMGTSGVLRNAFCIMRRSWISGGQWAGCGGLMRNVSHPLTYLYMWSPVGGAVWGDYGTFRRCMLARGSTSLANGLRTYNPPHTHTHTLPLLPVCL